MPGPLLIAAAALGSKGIGGLLNRGAEKKAQKARDAIAARLLGAQKAAFDTRYGLTNELNTALSGLETRRFNEVSGAETALRGDIGNESVTRFDEQADATGRQIAENRATSAGFGTTLSSLFNRGVATSEAERDRQLGFQGAADVAGAALPMDIGAAAQAATRAASKLRRDNVSATTISPPALDGPQADRLPGDPLTAAAFAQAGQRAFDIATARTGAANEVASYDDGVSAADRAISAFTDRTGRLRTQAETSRAALGSEIDVIGLLRNLAATRATEAADTSELDARGTIDISDRYRGGRIAAASDAGEANITSLADLFQRLNGTLRTGYGGQIEANRDYENRLTSLLQGAIGGVRGSSPLGSLLTTIGDAGLAYVGGGGGSKPAPRDPSGNRG